MLNALFCAKFHSAWKIFPQRIKEIVLSFSIAIQFLLFWKILHIDSVLFFTQRRGGGAKCALPSMFSSCFQSSYIKGATTMHIGSNIFIIKKTYFLFFRIHSLFILCALIRRSTFGIFYSLILMNPPGLIARMNSFKMTSHLKLNGMIVRPFKLIVQIRNNQKVEFPKPPFFEYVQFQ